MLRQLWVECRHSSLGERIRSLIPDSIVNLLFHLPLAIFATLYFRFPAKNLKVIGVTGTDGKTTTASLIHHCLIKGGKKAALITTISAKIGAEVIPTGFHVTSPHPWELQSLLRKIVDKGYEFVVLEVTSHGLAQHRLWGVSFYLGVITNVTHEHLDYHQTYENYLGAKAKLFKDVKIAVLNRDDKSYQYLSTKLQAPSFKLVTYGIKNKADFTPKTFHFKTELSGEYNQYNCLAAIATTSSLKIPEEIIRRALISFPGVEGRMEAVEEGQNFKVYVDFAHTPNALKQVLKTLKVSLSADKKLIVVFGSAGLRDRRKRPKMGQIASKMAKMVVLTAEDPRTEDIHQIINQIAKGCQKAGGVEGKTFYKIPDRAEAIRFAIEKAEKDDIVVICGKGHEKTMCFGKTEYPWSDQREARRALKERSVSENKK
jgi:UDP-N-acetylmuramoyl-L-alanyl-D-glutamate--2,6-diaminopimelate ligase